MGVKFTEFFFPILYKFVFPFKRRKAILVAVPHQQIEYAIYVHTCKRGLEI